MYLLLFFWCILTLLSIRTAEKDLDSLRSSLRGSDRRLIDTATLKRKLESANKQIEIYRSTPEGKLIVQLEAKDEEIRILKLKDTQEANVCSQQFLNTQLSKTLNS